MYTIINLYLNWTPGSSQQKTAKYMSRGREVHCQRCWNLKIRPFLFATHRTFLFQYHRELQFPIRPQQTKLGEIECDWALFFPCFTALQLHSKAHITWHMSLYGEPNRNQLRRTAMRQYGREKYSKRDVVYNTVGPRGLYGLWMLLWCGEIQSHMLGKNILSFSALETLILIDHLEEQCC